VIAKVHIEIDIVDEDAEAPSLMCMRLA